MITLFWIGTTFWVMSVVATILVSVVAWRRFHSAETQDYLEEYYKENDNAN